MLEEAIFDIQGWMGERELHWLHRTASKVPPGNVIVEIGAWRGRSSAAIYTGIQRGVSAVSVDTWKGSPDEPHEEAQTEDIHASYMANMAALGIEVKPFPGFVRLDGGAYYLKEDSLEAASLFPPGSILWLFEDGWHSHCGQNLDAWQPKVKPRGVHSGHDYFTFYRDVQQEIHKRFHIHAVVGTIWIRFTEGDAIPEWYA